MGELCQKVFIPRRGFNLGTTL